MYLIWLCPSKSRSAKIVSNKICVEYLQYLDSQKKKPFLDERRPSFPKSKASLSLHFHLLPSPSTDSTVIAPPLVEFAIEALTGAALKFPEIIFYATSDWRLLVSVSAVVREVHLLLLAYTVYALGSGAQPLTNDDGSVILSVNGEIYNYLSLQKSLKGKYDFKTQSDCEVLLYLVWIFCSERDIK